MGVTYVRRYRMELDFKKVDLPKPQLPDNYSWVAWDPDDVVRHAFVKYSSFRAEIDAQVFPCLGEYAGCRRLMHEISRQATFLPRATWLIEWDGDDLSMPRDCATIQGLAVDRKLAAVQNVGVVPQFRGRGLGRALVLKALEGFRASRFRRVYLEVTASNDLAIDLYHSIGFRLARTIYKAINAEAASV